MSRPIGLVLLALASVWLTPTAASAQFDVEREVPCCEIEAPHVVWAGADRHMSFDTLAAHCGPILWFSPDEPLLDGVERPGGIDLPMAFPFESPGEGPVVYYRIRRIIRGGEGEAFTPNLEDKGATVLDLDMITGVDIDYFFYYPFEEGLGGHVHDVESVEMKIAVFRQPGCEECRYGISIQLVNAKAHGILWYDNTLETDAYSEFPICILVEEGKHASCTDKNGDGYFTPGYDVSKRVNDAWGVRDVMRTGALFTGGFQSWLAKVRKPEDRVFPPLPADSRVREEYAEEGVYAPGYQIYEVRTYPTVEAAEEYSDPTIVHFVDKGHYDWPAVDQEAEVEKIVDWLADESFAKSISISARFDDDAGISVVFPLFVVKNFNDPVTGGWLVNRIYLKDHRWRDFGWNVIYTPSASRWIDSYVSVGLEVDKEDDPAGGVRRDTAFATETGIKFRGNISKSPLGFLGALTDFWGLRVGVRYKGYKNFSELGYVVEIGAGTF
jgi:hypothetical protein